MQVLVLCDISTHFEICTIFFQMLTAEIHNPWHLPVNRVKAELFVLVLLPFASCLVWQGELKSLQKPRLVVIEVSNAVHRHSTLSSRWVTFIVTLKPTDPCAVS